MPVYTTIEAVEQWTPSNLPDTIDNTFKTNAIAQASEEIDAALTKFGLAYKSNTQKFPDITDSPPTPVIIQEVAQWLAAYRYYVKLKEINKNMEMKQGFLLRDMAKKRLERINNGEMDVILSDGTKIERYVNDIYHTKDGVEPRINDTNVSDFDPFAQYE